VADWHEELAEAALSLDTRMHPCGRNRLAWRFGLAGHLLPARGSRGRRERPTDSIRSTDHRTNIAYRGDRLGNRRDPAARPSNILLKMGRCILLIEVHVRLSSLSHRASLRRMTLSSRHDRVRTQSRRDDQSRALDARGEEDALAMSVAVHWLHDWLSHVQSNIQAISRYRAHALAGGTVWRGGLRQTAQDGRCCDWSKQPRRLDNPITTDSNVGGMAQSGQIARSTMWGFPLLQSVSYRVSRRPPIIVVGDRRAPS